MPISLVKGQKVSLEKSGTSLKQVCVGLNWGAIETKKFFGGRKVVAVDLDASCAVFSGKNELKDIVYFGNLTSRDGAIRHSGDDRTGDAGGDDGLDNEIITVDFSRVDAGIDKVVFVLNSYKGQDFATVPFARIRIYEGSPERVDNVLATFDIAADPKYAGHVSMVMGRFYRHQGAWKFAAIGDSTTDRKLEDTIRTVARLYL
ncbi:MAG: TerD family protein [Magnetococcales bacterium]|nr:TerD family protein [Magnetococcales bacterium]